jgi:hypothetical protein
MEITDENRKQVLSYILVGFLLLVVSTAAIYLFLLQGSGNGSTTNTNTNTDVSVADEITTEEVTVTNIGSSTATVSWYTPQTSNGYVVYGTSSGNLTLEQRNSDTSEKNLHYIDISNLDANQSYFFQIRGDNETVTNASTYSFETLPESDGITTPDTLLITMPPTFNEGVIYAHASNGSSVSPSVSTYAFSGSVSLDIGELFESVNGDTYTAADAGLRLSGTSIEGDRFTADFALDVNRAEVVSSDDTSVAYSPETIFTPVTSTASDNPPVENVDQEQQEEQEETQNDPPVEEEEMEEPELDITPSDVDSGTVQGSGTSGSLPKTAIGDDPIKDLTLVAGVLFVLFGIKLTVSKKDSPQY